MRPPQPPTTYPSSELYCCNGLARSRCRRRHHDARQRRPPARVRHHTSDAKPPLLHAAKSRRQEYVERNTAPPKGGSTPPPLTCRPFHPIPMSLASPPGRLRCTGRRRRPIRIGSWAFTRTWVGEERWCPQQRPQGGKRRQKSASPLPVSLRQPRFPPDTDLLHQNTPEVDPARSKPNRGLGRDAWKGRGQYLQIWHACGSPSSRPNPQARRTPRQQGPPPLDLMASAKKRRRPRRHLPRRPRGLSRRSSPVAARRVGGGGGGKP